MLYLVIFFIVTVLVVIMIFLKINIVVEYIKKNKDDHLVLSFFTMGGIIKWKYEIPIMEVGKKGFKFRKVKEKGKSEKDIDNKLEKFKFEDIVKKVEQAIDFYKENKLFIEKLTCYIKKKLIFKEIKIYICMGVGDAAYTAILSGMAWSVMGIVISYLYNNFKVEKHDIDIKVNFMEKIFNIDLYCIFTIRLVHIIVVGLKILLHSRKKSRRKQVCRPLAA